ncbi:cytidine deaminase [Lachnospiraceae bacterium 46-61]
MTDEALIAQAKKAMENAYVPYSHFKVGAALLDKNGVVFMGCNIENASYGATCCAERIAIFKAVSEGIREFERIAIVSNSNQLTPPCGICRQVLWEFMPDGVVILQNDKEEIKTYTIKELLPVGFTL